LNPLRALAAAMLVVLARPVASQKKPPTGTYEFMLCHPTCNDSSSIVGRGVFVIVDGQVDRFLRGISLRDVPEVGWRGEPNACFRVSAKSHIEGREYYPSIIPVGLTAVTEAGEDFSMRLYASPDAFFSLVFQVDSAGNVSGQGRQNDWNRRGPVEFSVMSGHRVGAPDPPVCFKKP